MNLNELRTKVSLAREVGLIGKNYKVEEKTKAVLTRVVKTLQAKSLDTTRRIRKIIQNNLQRGKSVTFKLTKNQTILNVLKALLPINTEGLLPVIKYDGDNFYTMSKPNILRLINQLQRGDPNQILSNQFVVEDDGGSDSMISGYYTGSNIPDEVTIKFFDSAEKRNNTKVQGAFFVYTHGLNFDLSRYQIYKHELVDGEKFNDRYADSCLVHCLKTSGLLTESEIIEIKLMVRNNSLPFSKLKDLCVKLNFSIKLRRPRNDGDTRVEWINKGADRTVEIGLLENHYFLIERVELTRYAIEHYDEVKDKPNWNSVTLGRYSYLTSYAVIGLLLENKDKLLKPIEYTEQLLDTPLFKTYKCDYNNLEYGEHSVVENKYKEPRKEDDTVKYKHIVYFDFETTTDGFSHEPYLLCTETKNGKKNTYKGEYMIQDFLKSLKNKTLCYAHNLGYDFRFIIPKLTCVEKIIEKSNSTIIYIKGKYNKNDITFKCTYAMVNSPLRDFGAMFELDVKKEVLPYALYTQENVKKNKVLISDAIKLLKEEDHQCFMSNLKEWDLIIDDEYFDHMKYSENYCQLDVTVTRLGFEKFNKWLVDDFDMDTTDYMTLASLADSYLKKMGCYDGTYSISGIVRDFIQNCVVGGRTMTRNNEKYITKQILNDFDAVSLYPSAMIRLSEEQGGFIKGKPKVLKESQLSYSFLKNQDAYYVIINVTDVKKCRKFPLINHKVDGIRQFNNDVRGEIFVDKITLEDLIKFQNIKFTVKCGYYFNEGRNNKIGDVMKFLFNKRLELKKSKNPAQVIYKLLMNSSYGKSCLKPIDSEVQILENERFDKYLEGNYEYINYYCPIPNSKFTKVKSNKPILNHFNSCHIGCEILSMSKRIMNEVMCLAEDNDIEIYYQDTDSMHIEDSKIKTLAELYKKTYDKELIGKMTGQFHSDFDFKSEEEPVAVESIFLGKKSYIDKVQLVINGKTEYGYHMRMKGIPHKSLQHVIDTEFDKDPMKLYKHLYEGKKVEFNLLAGSVKFEACRNYDIKNKVEFIRELTF